MDKIPEQINGALESLISEKHILTWKLHARIDTTTLVLTWSQPEETIVVENPAKPLKPVRQRNPPSFLAFGKPATDCVSRPVDPASNPDKQYKTLEVRRKRRKKSPSTLRRDRERLESWKNRKQKTNLSREPSHKLDLPPFDDNFDSVQVSKTTPPVLASISPHESNESVPPEDKVTDSTTADPRENDLDSTNHSSLNSDDSYEEAKCFTCGICESDISVPLRYCTGCYFAEYCSHECQVQHWKTGHKGVCSSL